MVLLVSGASSHYWTGGVLNLIDMCGMQQLVVLLHLTSAYWTFYGVAECRYLTDQLVKIQIVNEVNKVVNLILQFLLYLHILILFFFWVYLILSNCGFFHEGFCY